MKLEGSGHYLRAVNDGARTVIILQSPSIPFDNVIFEWPLSQFGLNLAALPKLPSWRIVWP